LGGGRTGAAAAARVALVAAWPVVRVAWEGQQAEQGRQTLIEEVESAHLSSTTPGTPAPTSTRRGTTPVAVGVPAGEPFATVRIPRFGDDWQWPLLEGVSEDVITDGPGHYRGTPLPGARGNVGIAAHRAGHGNPFIDFDTLRPGDEVEITQGRTTWVYTLTTGPEIVPVDAMWVLDPTPGRTLTLTTCWPKYGSSERMYVHADLTDVRRDAG
jgi:sortase A